MAHYHHNSWKGFCLGMLGGIGGLVAMHYFWKKVSPAIEKQVGDKLEKTPQGELAAEYQDISIYGMQYRPGEAATDALGRIFYTRITGREPQTEETKKTLSYLVHWVYGILQGGMYGAIWGKSPSLTSGGLLFGTGLWLLGDEIAVPLLGLQPGPSSVTFNQHLERLGAHWAYGLGTAITTQALRRIF
jgi:hypothetical protein